MTRPMAWFRRMRLWRSAGLGWQWRRAGGAGEARRQEALAAFAQRALEGAESTDLVAHASVLVARILDLPYSAVLAWEPDERTLRVRAGVGWRAGVVGGHSIDGAALPDAAEAWRGWDPVVFEVLDREPRMAAVPLFRGHEIVSGCSVVIAPRGQPFGVLGAYADKRRRFEPPEVEFVRAVGKILAIALGREYGERALFEEIQMSTVLAHVGRELMSCADMSVLLARVCELTARALHCDHSVTWLRHQEEGGFRAVAAEGLPEARWEMLGSAVLSADGAATLLADLAKREAVCLDTASKPPPLLSALLERSGARCAMFAPLLKGEEIVGLQMSWHRDRGGEFTLQDGRVAHGIAQLASMGLMKARVVEEVERASQLKSEFVSTMSHELRTPLNIIIGYTDMLGDTATPEEQAPLLALIRKASHELLEIIDATLNLNRLAAGGDVARCAPVRLADLWRELEKDFRVLSPPSDVALRWESVDEIEIQTDRRKLKIIIKNLVGNALKFTPTGEIVAGYERVGDQCRFTVRDTGIGIPADALAHVFEMFRQVDSSETRSYGGAGLGLYIVKSLLTQLGGRVQVESREGKGSIFTVVLPIEQPSETAAPGPPSDPPVAGDPPSTVTEECPRHARRRLLFADDLPLNRFLMRRFVAREFPEVEVLEAGDGEQAVEMFEARKPHIVLLDLHMPQLDGWQAAQRIRQCEGGRDVPILALSVDASPEAEANAIRAGFKEFIAKPISDYSALQARLAFWLDLRDTRDRRTTPAAPSAPCESCRRDGTRASAA